MKKIMICSSMVFAKEMLEAKKILNRKGFAAVMSKDVEHYFKNPEHKDNFEAELSQSEPGDSLYEGLERVAEADSILVLNYEKNGVKGYIGASVLMELGLAYYLKKEIYFLYPVDENQKYALEVALIKPTILNGDIDTLK